MTDRAVSDLVMRTETFLARYVAVTNEAGGTIRPGKSYDAEAAAFYNEACGAAAAMLLRAEQKAHNEDEIKVLTNLEGRYRAMEKSHRLGPLTQSSASATRRSLRALSNIRLTKKHLGASRTGEAS